MTNLQEYRKKMREYARRFENNSMWRQAAYCWDLAGSPSDRDTCYHIHWSSMEGDRERNRQEPKFPNYNLSDEARDFANKAFREQARDKLKEWVYILNRVPRSLHVKAPGYNVLTMCKNGGLVEEFVPGKIAELRNKFPNKSITFLK